jgi:prepilin-type N-terminal cleavage/methylation domain-containing protein
MNRKSNSGFTLIELMIVVTIIGILAVIAIPKFASMVRKAHDGATKGGLGGIRSAISIYYSDMEGYFPQTIYALTNNGKYMSIFPTIYLDPYHQSYDSPGSVLDCWVTVLINDCVSASVSPENGAYEYGQPYSSGGGMTPNGDTGNVGRLWVSCSHTDSKGSDWTTY